jgi:hypothetical protein
MRGTDGFEERKCYVDLARGPLGIWECYRRGGYRFLPRVEYADVFCGRSVRFGAYGDPVLIPLSIMGWIRFLADKITGYTHQWRKPEYQKYRAHLMASCDSVAEYMLAKAMGWRSFRVRGPQDALLPTELSCPASKEAGHKTQCIKCGQCNGKKEIDKRFDYSIIVHGIGARNFVSVGAIARAA